MFHPVLNPVPGVNRFWPRACAAHVVEFWYAAPPVKNLLGFVKGQNAGLVVAFRVRCPGASSEVAIIFIIKDVQPALFLTLFAYFMVRVADNRKG